jgi:hypothetical protein
MLTPPHVEATLPPIPATEPRCRLHYACFEGEGIMKRRIEEDREEDAK